MLVKKITKSELQMILSSLRNKYVPSEDSSFMQELNKGQLFLLYDLINTKNKDKRKQKRQEVINGIEQSKRKIEIIGGQIRKLSINLVESKERVQENQDLLKIEQELERI